jgi:hypothetical protein
MRNKLIMVAALMAALALPVTAANARFGGFGGHVGGFGGHIGGWGGHVGGWGGFHPGFRVGGFGHPFFFHRPIFFHRPFFARRFFFGGPIYAGFYGSCWRVVWTPWGPARRWVCGYPGYY